MSALFLPFCSKKIKHALIQWWCSRITRILNIKALTTGEVPVKNTLNGRLIVANHISWIDIHALMACLPLRFIAKAEIRHWPVFGYLSSKANVLFIERGKRHDAGRIVRTVFKALKNGEHLCYFPEGTTTDGTHMQPFKGSVLQAAIDAKTVIQPVAIFYPLMNGNPNTHMAYAGETTLMESIQQILWQRESTVALHFFPPILLENASQNIEKIDRRILSEQIFNLIHSHLYRQ